MLCVCVVVVMGFYFKEVARLVLCVCWPGIASPSCRGITDVG